MYCAAATQPTWAIAVFGSIGGLLPIARRVKGGMVRDAPTAFAPLEDL